MKPGRGFLALLAGAAVAGVGAIAFVPAGHTGTGAAAAALPAVDAGAGAAAVAPAACTAPAWAEGRTYQTGDQVTYRGHTYRALVTHTAVPGAGWNPAATPSLWNDLGGCTGGGTTAPPPPTPTAAGVVYFQDTGTVQGWSNSPRPQKQGVLRNVAGPVYKGSTAIEARQTYINETGGYHAETVQANIQSVGEDKYYGQAIYLPPDWQYHNQNVTFQQWSPEDPEGPWQLMFVQNNQIRLGGSGGFNATLATIARGTWVRIVTRLKFHATNGAFEVWINGTKTWSVTGRAVLPKTSRTIRWSSGIYCTAWRDGTPAGQSRLSIFHDHARVASTYALAEPANW
jgi:chitodextrinase